jgi:hypothetical protein
MNTHMRILYGYLEQVAQLAETFINLRAAMNAALYTRLFSNLN